MFFMTLMIFHVEFSYHVSLRVLGSAAQKKIFPPSRPFCPLVLCCRHVFTLHGFWGHGVVYRLTRPFEAAGRLDEAFPSCKTYSCVKEKETSIGDRRVDSKNIIK